MTVGAIIGIVIVLLVVFFVILLEPKKKTADEIFKELGYNKDISLCSSEEIFIRYRNNFNTIEFDIENKNICVENKISLNELHAINKKCEEISWNYE